ncbi:hypothetical protein P775_08285 [Puniceibacterium antarcticum]|uniref:Uncharacterized protein n=1 Tax=Puniceibacterium antarcticum TaxID=1206336 RepID=A0A2G8RG25_9RHOB|nr:hypothetical protein [Puniceibacterium antarcticum]PIL20517.1 hypothetical protein P775_08285 [Puniceibacterium antarcticum]
MNDKSDNMGPGAGLGYILIAAIFLLGLGFGVMTRGTDWSSTVAVLLTLFSLGFVFGSLK